MNESTPVFELDRRQAVPAIVGRHEDFLIVAGLAGTSKDMAALTDDGPHLFSMASDSPSPARSARCW